MTKLERWKNYPIQVLIAIDQLLNALLPPFGSLSYADETLSARCYRSARDGRVLGKFFLPIIDGFFRWQGPTHCYRAYLEEKERRQEPPEYRE
jgi:hypothetical protein